jgi:NAD(P)-dependent dehydrogenase (short-subunit alcohol dehydrogenase family)
MEECEITGCRCHFTARRWPSRPGRHWDVGWAAAFLASDEARWITGATLPVVSGVLSVTPLMMAPHLRSVAEPES